MYVPIVRKVGWKIYSYKVLARLIKRSNQTVIIWYHIRTYVRTSSDQLWEKIAVCMCLVAFREILFYLHY